MSQKRRKFKRSIDVLPYRKIFFLAVEGAKTERQYFDFFKSQNPVIQIHCLKGKHKSSPRDVLKRMKKKLINESLRDFDEAWLVVDKDNWTDEQLTQLHAWSLEHKNYGLALSNPKFEYWLLLHFDNGKNINSSSDCTERLKRFLPHYNKNINAHQITREKIKEAINRAKNRDNPPCTDWPRTVGCTTVYKLVQNIIQG